MLALPASALDEVRLPSDSARIMDAVDEAIAAYLIEEVEHSPGDYRFVHALIQQTLTAELSTTVKIRLHARIAETLEHMHGNGTDARLGELVRHFSEAEALVGSDKLVKYLILAGEQALSTYAYEEALEYFRHALDAKGETKPMTSLPRSFSVWAGRRLRPPSVTRCRTPLRPLPAPSTTTRRWVTWRRRCRSLSTRSWPLRGLPASPT